MLRKEKKDRKKYIIGLFIVGLMASSALALFSGGGNHAGNDYSYNGQDFYLHQRGYVTEVDDNTYYFDFLPKDVEDMEFDAYPFSIDKVYIDADNESLDVIIKLETLFVSKGILPIIEEKECDEGLVVIKVIEGEDNKVYIDNACIVLEGNIYKTSDRFAYWYLGII